ncbi:hypothetical protein CC80DRAFT_91548 [Byssothecium circinans]|uniref:BZIP domain-containing protein n=1 Tax=Byssothecium circinans TaxID=147558 RepID=A0A6A5TUI2_9PLEO|nr:hypothetical protein CC80DRAFT_91548 [Byssothecium circinans]
MTSVLHYRDPAAYRTNDLMSTTNYVPPHMATMKKSPSYEGHSSGSERKMSGSSSVKKRPSRAGTRSVTTLTAAQLERKRANDREAQRAIRQRTKDHIDALERQVRDLSNQLETNSSGKMMEVLRRNDELEQENAILRARLSHAVQALGMPEGSESSNMMSATGGARSPSDRIQILSQPRRTSTSTARSAHSIPEMNTTPVSQPPHWQSQHNYAQNMPSPHVEHPQTNWNTHPSAHQSHPTVSISIPEPTLHAVENVSYPSPYGMENNTRSMSYPLENNTLVTSQPPQMGGYSTPTSNPSPHPNEYQRHMSVPMNAPAPTHPSHQHPYPNQGHQGYVPQSSHPGDMQMMAPAPHPQSQMMSEQGQMMYHMQPHMKVEHPM